MGSTIKQRVQESPSLGVALAILSTGTCFSSAFRRGVMAMPGSVVLLGILSPRFDALPEKIPPRLLYSLCQGPLGLINRLHRYLSRSSYFGPFNICLLAPLAEEVQFRVFLQPLLCASLGPVVGIGLTSLLFGLAHRRSYRQIPAKAILGGIMGLLAYRVSWIAGLGLHISINTVCELAQIEEPHWGIDSPE